MSVTTTTGWEALGAYRRLAGHQVFTIDAPPLGPEEHEPVLALHGFPTSSFDYAAVLDRLRANRRVVLLDFLGFGLSDKPDLHYTLALQADLVVALVDELELDRVALLTHDMGDTVGGELLARRHEGTWPVLANGSIYIDQAHLTDGQQFLLALPDEKLPAGQADAGALATSLRATFSPRTPTVPDGWPEDPLPDSVGQLLRQDGASVLPRTIRYLEERRANERRFTGAIETDRWPCRPWWTPW
jgi:pimeloyl-ACP methyl ester carboxylesterase